MNVTEQIIDIETTDGPMAVTVTQPDDGERYPTIVNFHDAPGVRGSLHDFNKRLAAEGYRVVMPDLHHRFGRMIGFEADETTPEARQKIVEMFGAMTDQQIEADLDSSLELVDLEPGEKLGTIGFCLGARAVYRTLRRLPDQFAVGASWHPSMLVHDPESPHLTAATLKQPLYLGIGTADQVQSIEMQQQFFDVVAPLDHVEVTIFEGADHGFSWPSSPNYHEKAASTSWDKTTALFASVLK